MIVPDIRPWTPDAPVMTVMRRDELAELSKIATDAARSVLTIQESDVHGDGTKTVFRRATDDKRVAIHRSGPLFQNVIVPDPRDTDSIFFALEYVDGMDSFPTPTPDNRIEICATILLSIAWWLDRASDPLPSHEADKRLAMLRDIGLAIAAEQNVHSVVVHYTSPWNGRPCLGDPFIRRNDLIKPFLANAPAPAILIEEKLGFEQKVIVSVPRITADLSTANPVDLLRSFAALPPNGGGPAAALLYRAAV